MAEREYITKLDGGDFDAVLSALEHLNRLPARLRAEDRALSEALRARDMVDDAEFRNNRRAELGAEFVHKVAEFDQYINQTIRDSMDIFRRIAVIVDRNYNGIGLFNDTEEYAHVENRLYEQALQRIPPHYVDASLLVFACRGIDKMVDAAALTHHPADLAIRREDWKAINVLLEKIQPVLDSLESIEEILERQQVAKNEKSLVNPTKTQPFTESQLLPRPRRPVAPVESMPEPAVRQPQPPLSKPAPRPEPAPAREETLEPAGAGASSDAPYSPQYRYRLSRDHLIAKELGKAITQPTPAAASPASTPSAGTEKPALRVVARRTPAVTQIDDIKLVNDLVSLFKKR